MPTITTSQCFSLRVRLGLLVVGYAVTAACDSSVGVQPAPASQSSAGATGAEGSVAGAGGRLSATAGAGASGVAGASAASGGADGGATGSSEAGANAANGGSGATAGSANAGTTGASGTGAGGASASGGSGAAGDPAAAGTGGAGMVPTPSKKFVGNITTAGQVRSDFGMLWDQITPENEGKWGSVEATRDQMNWAGLDRVRDYAQANGIVFKQHAFVWGSQQPSWVASLTPEEQRAEVEEWIREFCERYPDVALIDVVNEPPPHTSPAYLEALGGAGQSGYDWIVQSFEWAHQYCPNSILILNDYNNIEYGNDNQHFIDIVNALKQAGAPIDAIGAQAHDAHKLSNDVLQGFIDKLAETGLPLYITEYDIDVASDSEQQQVMERQFPLFWNDERIAGITLWGYVVGSTWRANTGLMTNDGMPRPALTWLRDFLKR
jgi:endo-1,4-beta-xylanase